MSRDLFAELLKLKDTRLHEGLDASVIADLARDRGITLAADHIAVLQQSNGIEAYSGYIRFFGLQSAGGIDALAWNEPDCWKFAWGGRCDEFWSFGETAWGDQYAYSFNQLRSGAAEANVYFLDALSMTPQIVASSFTQFMKKEFLRSAREPYDEMLIQARRKLGPLESGSHLVYVPSVLLGGAEEIGHVQKMNARAAMICNGDIATQLDAGPAEAAVKGVESYEDELRRMRLRLVWT
jgi:hypothetical protein